VFGSACCWQLGGGSCQPQRPHTNKFLPAKKSLFLRQVRPLCRYHSLKTTLTRHRKASPEQSLRSAGKILTAPKFCQKKTDIPKGGNLVISRN
jgi:hypothetical protein